MEKRRPRPAAGPDGGRGHPVPRRRRRRRRHHRPAAARPLRRGRARDRRDRRRATCRCRVASSTACSRRWSTCRRPTGSAHGEQVEGQITRRGQARRRSSAAATPAPTASAPRIGRAPRSVTQLEIMPRPPEERPEQQPWPTYPMIYRVVERPRGGRRAGLRGQHRGVPRRRRRPASRALRLVEVELRRRPVRARSRAPSARSRRSWCCSRWASSGRRARALVEQLGVELDAARQRRAGRALHDDGAGRLRRRRRRSRPVAHRLGDRRGPGRGRRASTRYLTGPAPRCPARSTRPTGRSRCEPARRRRPACGRRHARPRSRTRTRIERHAPRQDRLHPRPRRRPRRSASASSSTAGMDVARLNLSHGAYADHEARLPRRPRGQRRDRPRRRHPGRPAGPEDPRSAGSPTARSRSRTATGSPSPRDDVLGDAGPVSARRTRACPATSAPGDLLLIDDGKVALRVDRGRRRPTSSPRSSRAARSPTTRASTCPASRSACPALSEKDEDDLRWALRLGRRHDRAVLRASAPRTSSACTQIMDEEGVRLPGHRQDREAAGGRQPRGDHRRLRRDHGGPRRPRRRAAARGGAAGAEARGRDAPGAAPSRSSSPPRCSSR